MLESGIGGMGGRVRAWSVLTHHVKTARGGQSITDKKGKEMINWNNKMAFESGQEGELNTNHWDYPFIHGA